MSINFQLSTLPYSHLPALPPSPCCSAHRTALCADGRDVSVPTFNGLAQIIIQTTEDEGDITVNVSSPNLSPATIKLNSTISQEICNLP